MKQNLVFGIQGFKATTPAWAAKASNYLLIATVALFLLNNILVDWSDLIQPATKQVFELYLSSIEKTLTTIATALRFLGVNPNQNEDSEGGNN